MPTIAEHVVVREQTRFGRHGERLMARSRHVELRLWERDPAGEAVADPDTDHDHVVYVQSGALIVTIADDPPVEVHQGDSYLVPAGAHYRFEVLEPATVVEAIGPAGHSMI
jgi:mannose-6-phosphate isomerase-like protein (cupin superfamily)